MDHYIIRFDRSGGWAIYTITWFRRALRCCVTYPYPVSESGIVTECVTDTRWSMLDALHFIHMHTIDNELSTGPTCVSSKKALHEEQTFCTELLATVKSAVPLQISQSTIPGAGTGLFVTEDVDLGQELFRSIPVVNCVEEGYQHLVCDYCYVFKDSKISFNGRFRTAEDRKPNVQACARCNMCYYCSRVICLITTSLSLTKLIVLTS